MKRMKRMIRIAAAGVLLAAAGGARAEEAHVAGVVAEVLATAAKVRAAGAVPMAVWDFDGTIIEGDLTLGLEEGGVRRFSGLLEDAITAGYSQTYRGAEGWRLYNGVDRPRFKEIGQWLAVPVRAQIFAGSRLADLEVLADAKVAALRRWYFASSVKILEALAAAGVVNCVVSGSPEMFVRAAGATLGIPPERMRGLRVAVEDGRITRRLLYPQPIQEGKIDIVRDLEAACPGGVAVAGFGNDYLTDGPFLRHIVETPLPGGAKGFALMINGKRHNPVYDGLFRCVTQTELVGASD